MSLYNQLSCFVSQFRNDYRLRAVEDVPDKCADKTIYIIGNPDTPQYAVFLCPCGCGRTVELNLNTSSSPHWSVEFHLSGTISFAPSIWRKSGCYSHFFLERNKIRWCKSNHALNVNI